MTQQVRKGYRNHRKGTWAGVLLVFGAAALALVLPALAINTSSSGGVPPATGQEISPSLVNVGGSNFRCGSAGELKYGDLGMPAGMRQFQISKPTPGPYTDPATGVTFVVTGPTDNQDPRSHFSFSVSGTAAVVYHVGVNGGTKSVWYDYFNNVPTAAAFPNGGVFGDTNLHSTPDSKYAPTPPSSNTFYTASITTFCYLPLTVTPSCTSPFSGLAFGGTGGTVQYSAQLVPNGTTCKDGKVVMYSYTPGTNELFATLNPVTEGGTKYKVVERLRWTGITGDIQNPIDLWYDDTFPYDGENKRVMKLCGSDPRSDPNSFSLNGATPAMPPADGAGPHTSCMLQSTDSAGSGTSGRTFDAWIYSLVDGARGFG